MWRHAVWGLDYIFLNGPKCIKSMFSISISQIHSLNFLQDRKRICHIWAIDYSVTRAGIVAQAGKCKLPKFWEVNNDKVIVEWYIVTSVEYRMRFLKCRFLRFCDAVLWCCFCGAVFAVFVVFIKFHLQRTRYAWNVESFKGLDLRTKAFW